MSVASLSSALSDMGFRTTAVRNAQVVTAYGSFCLCAFHVWRNASACSCPQESDPVLCSAVDAPEVQHATRWRLVSNRRRHSLGFASVLKLLFTQTIH